MMPRQKGDGLPTFYPEHPTAYLGKAQAELDWLELVPPLGANDEVARFKRRMAEQWQAWQWLEHSDESDHLKCEDPEKWFNLRSKIVDEAVRLQKEITDLWRRGLV